METKPQRSEGKDRNLSSLNIAIEAMNLAKEISSITPAKAVFGSVSILLAMVRDSMANELDYVELSLACADVCNTLHERTKGKQTNELCRSVCEAIEKLKTTVERIRKKITTKRERNPFSRLLNAKNDKDTIAAWKVDFNRFLHVFNTELALTTHAMVSEIRGIVVGDQERVDNQHRSTPASVPGESPPPPPRDLFGRDDLIEKIVGLAEKVTPFALIGTGGIDKTSIALTVLHSNRVKQRFGDDRRFIRCDQFPTSLTHFLRRLSEVIGAGIENPNDLTPIRPFLSSKEMFIILDNAESVLDPRGADSQGIYAAVEELSQFDNVCLGVTSRIATIPPACETLDIPTLSAEAARDTFYRIYGNGERPDLVNNILKQLDFHALSITLLATVAHQNRWDTDQLTKEWEKQRTDVLHTHHNKSLAATIELSLASPMFQGLGPDARELLGVIAFFPQGVDENNLKWLFPTISNGANIFNRFRVLSLTHRSNGFITMLAPLRDHLFPKDPRSSPLLCAAKDHYFGRLSVGVYPGKPGYEDAGWVKVEDVNIEHLLDVFTTIDTDSNYVWDVCSYFMEHLDHHKSRLVLLGSKIEALPDAHPSKPRCLFELSQLFSSAGNDAERKRLLIHTLKLWRERGDDSEVASTLRMLSDANRLLDLHEEGIQQAREALEIHGRLNDTFGQAHSLCFLACLLYGDRQLDAAEEAASQSTNLLPGKADQSLVSQCHRVLRLIHSSKRETEKAIDSFEAALKIASSFDWHFEQFWNHCGLAELFFNQGRFNDSDTHVERAKLHAVNNMYYMGRAMNLQAWVWYKQCRFGEARSESLCAVDAYEKAGATRSLEICRNLIRYIEEEMEEPTASCESDPDFDG